MKQGGEFHVWHRTGLRQQLGVHSVPHFDPARFLLLLLLLEQPPNGGAAGLRPPVFLSAKVARLSP